MAENGEPREAVTVIRTMENGPYQVQGPLRIEDPEGNQWDVGGRTKVSLCRCGGSTNKPFCDGTHSKLGFEAAERAVAEAEESD